MAPPSDLIGKNAIVFGASDPAAAAIAVALAQAGADIALTTTTSDAEEAFELRRLSKKVTEAGRRSWVESLDISLATNIQVAVRQLAKQLEQIDIVVVAADLPLEPKPPERVSDADWAKVVGHNLSGVFYVCRAVAREMLRREPPSGRIIVLDKSEGASDAAYLAAKSGAAALIAALDEAWRPQGIRVSLLEARDEDTAVQEALRLASEA